MPSRAQLALKWPVFSSYSEEDFLVHSANQHAFSFFKRWPDWNDYVVCLEGPKGSGKTHLASIWAATTQAHSLPCAELRIEMIPDVFHHHALVLEDAPGENLDETALFHAINLARETQSWLLITTSCDPAHWAIQLKDLASRLRAIPRLLLGPPDDVLLNAVFIKLFADRQLEVDAAVISYLIRHMHRSFQEAQELVERIDYTSLSEHSIITRRLASRILKQRMRESDEDLE